MTATSTRPSTNAEARPMAEVIASLDKAIGALSRLSERAKLRQTARHEFEFALAFLLMAATKLLASRKGWPIHRVNAIATVVGVATFIAKEAQHRKGGS